MATVRIKRKLAALNKENCEEHPWSKLAQNSIVPRSQEKYITQVSEEIDGRVTRACLTLKQPSFTARRRKTLAQKMATTPPLVKFARNYCISHQSA